MEIIQSQNKKVAIVIAGGRYFRPTRTHLSWVLNIVKSENATEIVSGCAKGADTFGEQIAKLLNLKLVKFPADWDAYGKSAGHIRNEQMAQYATHVVLFPGGRGTANMKLNALRHKLKIFEYPEN